MKTIRFLTVVSAILAAGALAAPAADAQSTPVNATKPATQAKRKPAAKPATTATATNTAVAPVALNPTVAPPPPSPLRAVPLEQKCLRALNGECTDPVSVEAARLRAEIIPAVRLSYFGTPAGTIGGDYIPFERFFQDNPLVFGLPTFTFVQPCCVSRTK